MLIFGRAGFHNGPWFAANSNPGGKSSSDGTMTQVFKHIIINRLEASATQGAVRPIKSNLPKDTSTHRQLKLTILTADTSTIGQHWQRSWRKMNLRTASSNLVKLFNHVSAEDESHSISLDVYIWVCFWRWKEKTLCSVGTMYGISDIWLAVAVWPNRLRDYAWHTLVARAISTATATPDEMPCEKATSSHL